ncbi:hypothetical protein H696_02332 [Fonticula alba]|uniref:NADPH-dependent FMN reductase-like domain-containing protein n=1 Tax=Fonticula alba TaxID=691883 RepID=A0A058ZBS5_FONAL|nr:hypothetical protein H696_02332 [Fonticula alba]KCV71381.1 hypothetical protein H696_02332 [Fonticula alba]|eukprot:XP_009494504.1 hypothetical protein H696_02332 [Fonticula alba]
MSSYISPPGLAPSFKMKYTPATWKIHLFFLLLLLSLLCTLLFGPVSTLACPSPATTTTLIMSAPIKVVVFLGSVREGRNGIRLANMILNTLRNRNIDVEFADAADYNLPVFQKYGFQYTAEDLSDTQTSKLAALRNHIREADAFVAVTGEYNANLQPGLLNLIDSFVPDDYAKRPVAIASYSIGPLAGARTHGLSRALFGNLGAFVIPKIVAVPTIHEAISEEGADLTPNKFHETAIGDLITELTWYAEAIAAKRKNDSA